MEKHCLHITSERDWELAGLKTGGKALPTHHFRAGRGTAHGPKHMKKHYLHTTSERDWQLAGLKTGGKALPTHHFRAGLGTCRVKNRWKSITYTPLQSQRSIKNLSSPACSRRGRGGRPGAGDPGIFLLKSGHFLLVLGPAHFF